MVWLRHGHLVIPNALIRPVQFVLHWPTGIPSSQVRDQDRTSTVKYIQLTVCNWPRLTHPCPCSYRHRFYHEHFKDYPRLRKALIPFIFWKRRARDKKWCSTILIDFRNLSNARYILVLFQCLRFPISPIYHLLLYVTNSDIITFFMCF